MHSTRAKSFSYLLIGWSLEYGYFFLFSFLLMPALFSRLLWMFIRCSNIRTYLHSSESKHAAAILIKWTECRKFRKMGNFLAHTQLIHIFIVQRIEFVENDSPSFQRLKVLEPIFQVISSESYIAECRFPCYVEWNAFFTHWKLKKLKECVLKCYLWRIFSKD